MDSDNYPYERISEIFLRVCELDPSDQRAALTELCGNDTVLQREVQSMLSHDSGDGLESPASAIAELSSEQTLSGRFGHFELHDVLGEGGMGVVYRATDRTLDRTVAVKIIPRGRQRQLRFQAEARAVARLEHPGIVPVYELGEQENRHYIAMRFIDGQDLKEYVGGEPLPATEAASLMRQIAEAVDYVHQRGFIHRDIKPSNILIDASGRPQLTDFGLARDLQHDNALTMTGQLLGTPSYMSPEQATGSHDEVGPSADIYGIGAVLYFLLTGKPPFEASTLLETTRNVAMVAPVRPRDLNEHCPRDLETICLKCLEKEPRRRYLSAGELAADLDRFLNHQPIHARRVGTLEKCWLWCRRHPGVMATAVVILCLFLLGGSAVWETRARTKSTALLDRLLAAQTTEVPEIVEAMTPWRSRLNWQLQQKLATAATRNQRLHLRLALLPTDASQSSLLVEHLLDADIEQTAIIRDALLPWQDDLAETLWQVVLQQSAPSTDPILPAASVLAAFAPRDPRWDEVGDKVAAQVVDTNSLVKPWVQLLRPVHGSLADGFNEIARDQGTTKIRRTSALKALTEMVDERPELLAELLMTVEPDEFHLLLPALNGNHDPLAALLRAELDRVIVPRWPEPTQTFPVSASPEIIDRIESAEGIVTQQFALCQSLPLDVFEATCQRLGEAGYRPVRFRPYRVADAMLVAGMWTRDGLEWQIATNLSPDDYQEHNFRLRQQGYIPFDVAGYFPGDEPNPPFRCVGVWMRTGHLRLVTVKTGVLTEAFQRELRVDVEHELKAQTLHFVRGPDGRRWTSQILHNRLHGRAEGDREIAATDTVIDLPYDSVLSSAGSPEIELAGLWSSDRAYRFEKSDEGVAAAVDTAWNASGGIDRLRDLAAKGYRPAGVAVSTDQRQPWQMAAWHWRQPSVPATELDALASRQANAILALMQLGQVASFRNALRQLPDSQLRTYLIHRVIPSGIDPKLLLDLLEQESDDSVRRGLLLSLGRHAHSGRSQINHRELLRASFPMLAEIRRRNVDAGVESAFEWLFRSWEFEPEFVFSTDWPNQDSRNWTLNSQGQKMIRLDGPVDVLVGAPIAEPGVRVASEYERIAHIPRSFQISATEVTNAQFQNIAVDPRELQLGATNRYAPSPDCPVNEIGWLDGIKYCRWLSEHENMPEEEMCYPPIDEINLRLNLTETDLSKTGYRLPTFEEWEYACRAGTRTSRHYGHDPQLLREYAWYGVNSNDRSWPVGLLKPNDFGLFDTLGNVGEWCHASHCLRAFRGEHFASQAAWVRAACYATVAPDIRYRTMGFRIARTVRAEDSDADRKPTTAVVEHPPSETNPNPPAAASPQSDREPKPESNHSDGLSLIVPAYFYPFPTKGQTHQSADAFHAWQELKAFLEASAERDPNTTHTIIVNPNTGPGTVRDPNYARMIVQLKQSGARVVGYLAIGRGSGPTRQYLSAAEVEGLIDRWVAFYPSIDGFFMDVAPTQESDLAEVAKITALCRERLADAYTIANPGTIPAKGYFDDQILNTIVVFEDQASRLDAFRRSGLEQAKPDQLAWLIWNSQDYSRVLSIARSNGIGHIFVTNRNTASTGLQWGGLPTFFGELAAALQARELAE